MRQLAGSEVLRVEKATRADKNVFPFLFTYVVPLLAPTSLTTLEQQGTNVAGLGVFVVIMFVVLARTKLHDVNPVLSLFGYHFFEVEAGKLGSVLLLTKTGAIAHRTSLRAIRLSDYLWLEKPIASVDTKSSKTSAVEDETG